MPSALHVMPVHDQVAHEAEDDCCCGPTAKPVARNDGSMGWVLVHHALDGRERAEGEATTPGG